MALAKLTIEPEGGAAIEVLFNPTQVTLQKSANWRLAPKAEADVPESQFTHGDPAVLTLELFFDTYASGTDVRQLTDRLYYLTTIQQHPALHRPPLCKLHWGESTFNDADWVLENLTQTFTLFLETGRPVRANCNCTFREWRGAGTEAKLLRKESADVAKLHTVRQGQSLSQIAYAAYQDPRLWRHIAAANHIDDPRALASGQVLALPTLPNDRSAQSP